MKKISTLLTLLIIALSASAAQRLTVFKVKGEVTAEINGSTVILTPRTELSMQTMLHIPDGAQLSILNQDTKTVFRSTAPGSMKVAKSISESRKKSDSMVKNILTEIYRDIADGSGGVKNAPGGVVMRGDGDMSVERAVAYAILAGKNTGHCPLKLSRAYSADSSYVYRIESASSSPLFINIANAGTTPPALMLDVRYSSGQPYIAVGQGTTTLDAFEFYGEPTGPLYIVATNIPFDTQAVQTLLRNPATSGTPAPIPTGLSIALMPVQ